MSTQLVGRSISYRIYVAHQTRKQENEKHGRRKKKEKEKLPPVPSAAAAAAVAVFCLARGINKELYATLLYSTLLDCIVHCVI